MINNAAHSSKMTKNRLEPKHEVRSQHDTIMSAKEPRRKSRGVLSSI